MSGGIVRARDDSCNNATERTRLVRMMLEGAGVVPLALGGVLTPTVEAELRYDTGDAAQAYQLEVRYGLDGRQGRARWAPYIGVESGGGSAARRTAARHAALVGATGGGRGENAPRRPVDPRQDRARPRGLVVFPRTLPLLAVT